MGIYSVAVYGVDKYGEAPRLAYSVAPFLASATTYNSVELSWTQPEGDYTSLRLVRSQDGYSETEEDGVILWEWLDTSGEPRITTFTDEPEAVSSPLVSGRFAYYTIWALKDTGTWTNTGEVVTVVPAPHASSVPGNTSLISTQEKLMDYLPRVYTSRTQSPLDVVDPDSELYRFMSAFSFTLDELLTLADNILPDESGRFLGPALVDLGAQELGFAYDPYLPVKNKKRLVREGIDIFAYKGTANSVASYAESLTGFAPTLTVSPNLMLGLADSTFYKSTGFWYPTGDCTLSLETTIPTVTTSTETNTMDLQYCARVEISTAGAGLKNGDYNPVTRGIPVDFSNEYTFSYYIKTDTGTIDVTPSISWYDYKGTLLSTVTAASASTATTSWLQQSFTATAPGEIYEVTQYAVVSDTVTLTTSSAHLFLVGDNIEVVGVDSEVDGVFTVTAKTSTTVSYDLEPNTPALNVATTAVSNATVAPDDNPAVYASVYLEFDDTGTAYLDLVQFADSSVSNYDEARAVEVFLEPSKTNFLTNPTFNSGNTSDWTVDADSSTYETVDSRDVLTIVANAGAESSIAASTAAVTTGKYYTFSIYAKMVGLTVTAATVASNVATITLSASPAWQVGDTISVNDVSASLNGEHEITAISGNQVSYAVDAPDQTVSLSGSPRACRPETMNLKVDAYDTVDSAVTDTRTSEDFLFTDSWARYSTTLFVNLSSNATRLDVSVVGDTAGCSMSFDDAQVEESYLPTDYFDGSFPVAYGAVWEGTAHDSASHIYPNKGGKLIRLKENLKEYLPINTAYRIRTYAGLEYSVLPQQNTAMDLLLIVVVAGMATGYVTELASSLTASWWSTSITKRVLTIPLGVLFSWLLGVNGLALVVTAPAAGFLALVVMSIINRPVVVTGGNRRL